MIHIRQKVLINALVVFLFVFLANTAVFADDITGSKTGTVTVQVLNLRQSPETTSKILSKIKYGEQVKIITGSKEWSKVDYNNIIGWVFNSYIKISKAEEITGKVKVNILNVRKEPGVKAAVVSKLKKGKTLQILDASKDWYKIKTADGVSGWVCADYVTVNKVIEERKTNVSISRGSGNELSRTDEMKLEKGYSEEMPDNKEADIQYNESEQPADSIDREQESKTEENNAPLSQQVIDYAKTFAGTKYKYGGNTPDEGFDCSGFTKYVFSYFNINLERTAASQACQGTQINKEELAIGDLIFFDTSGSGKSIDHVGIYMGDNNFIHASSPQYGVITTSLSDNYYQKTYVSAVRILNG